jgi:hypothetical protein
MPAPIVIELTPGAQAVIAKLQRFPQEMGQAIKRGMDDAGNTAWREITIQRFSGKGPFPVVEHRLGSRTERLKQSLFYRAATVATVGSNVAVTGTMGSYGVKYFPWHEYGYTGIQRVPSHFRKNLRFSSKHKPKPIVIVKGYTRTMNIPARAAMHHGIADHKILFQTKIQQELEKTLNAKP